MTSLKTHSHASKINTNSHILLKLARIKKYSGELGSNPQRNQGILIYLLKLDQIGCKICWEIREIDIFEKIYSMMNPWNQKSWNLDQDSRRNHQVNDIKISEFENHKKQKLTLTKITIQNWNLKLYEEILGWNSISHPRFHLNWSNYSPDQRLFIPKFKKWSLMFKSRFLPILSTKSHFQALRGRGNWSRSDWKQEIIGIWCLETKFGPTSLKIEVGRTFTSWIIEDHLKSLGWSLYQI